MFVPPFICKFVLEFYNLVNGPVDNTVVRPSRVRGEREKKKEDRIDERKMQAQQVPVILKPKTIRRQDTVSYPAPPPNPTANCRPDFRSCSQNNYTGFHLHAWDVLDQVAEPTFRYWSRNRVKDRWTQSHVGDSPWPKVKLSNLPVTGLEKTLDSRTYLSIGSYGPRTESHGPHTGRMRAPYNPADWSCGCFKSCTSARTRMDLTEPVG